MEFTLGAGDPRFDLGSVVGSARSSRRQVKKRCPSCDEDAPTLEGQGRLCRICGEELVDIIITADSSNLPVVDTGSTLMESLFDFLGEDLRAAIEASNARANPQRQISQEYMSSLGKIELDERRGLLYDVYLRVGSLSVLAVPASFGPLPSTSITGGGTTEISSRILIGRPEYGETDMLLENARDCADSVVLLKRGKVSFAAKARAAERSGASALIVAQSAENTWPFVMTDSSGEIADASSLSIPVVMISQADAKLVEDIVRNSAGAAAANESDQRPRIDDAQQKSKKEWLPCCCLHFGAMKSECSICQEDMEAGQVVLKLVCRHAYHESCVRAWLETHNTCPLCRNQMPTERRQTRAQQTRDASDSDDTRMHRVPYFR